MGARGWHARPHALAKSLYVDHETLQVRGVTYGTFESRDGSGFPRRDQVARDFAAIAAAGGNAVRTYTIPPPWLLDLAQDAGLHVLVGLPWEEHVAFLDDRGTMRSIRQRVGAGARACASHPAILGYAVGNEIPASIVRWHGRRKIERFLEDLYEAVKEEDPEALVTYINYPSTEYLHLPFVDLVCFNVFVESAREFDGYLARLQNISGDRPLLITELGLDSRRNGLDAQARALDRQVRSAFAAGCAGLFVFSWTDEWHRGGRPVENWSFGLVDRERRPKPALTAVREAFAEVPFPADVDWPKVSVIVCVYNGESTLRACLEGVRALEYPDFETIVVDDGSTDSTADVASQFGFRLIRTENDGLASARNVGLRAATGEIVAYLDADARPDPNWLSHLAHAFLTTSHSGIGGPNIPPSSDGLTAAAIANAPGGPIHVLLTDREAEHIPGCNMAFRRACLDAIGGFDPQFRIAGDDVDVCWRMHERGWTLGFSAGAVVWHHRRGTVRAYLRQQYEYGKAEARLERKWPAKYNGTGHLAWGGRVYGNGRARVARSRRWRVYYGIWGTGPFQPAHEEPPSIVATLPLLPEWYLVLAGLAGISVLGGVWRPLLLGLPLLLAALAVSAFDAGLVAMRARFPGHTRRARVVLRCLTACLHMLQPFSRLLGRLRGGLTPWRTRGSSRHALPAARTMTVWSDRWQASEERIRAIERSARALGSAVMPGSVYDRWDLQVRAGIGGTARVRVATEEHGRGRQLLRIRLWPRLSRGLVVLVLALLALATVAAVDHAAIAASVLAGAAALFAWSVLRGCAAAAGTVVRAVREVVAASGDLLSEPRKPFAPVAAPNAVVATEVIEVGGWSAASQNGASALSSAPDERLSGIGREGGAST